MKTQHTPGPWTERWIQEMQAWHIYSADGKMIASLYNARGAQPDALLMSLAPELLKVLKLMLEVRNPLYSGAVSEQEADAKAEAVIAKAEAGQ